MSIWRSVESECQLLRGFTCEISIFFDKFSGLRGSNSGGRHLSWRGRSTLILRLQFNKHVARKRRKKAISLGESLHSDIESGRHQLAVSLLQGVVHHRLVLFHLQYSMFNKIPQTIEMETSGSFKFQPHDNWPGRSKWSTRGILRWASSRRARPVRTGSARAAACVCKGQICNISTFF